MLILALQSRLDFALHASFSQTVALRTQETAMTVLSIQQNWLGRGGEQQGVKHLLLTGRSHIFPLESTQ